MASGAARPSSGRSDASRSDKPRSGQTRSAGRVIEYQTYIDGELRKTRSRVKWVDISASLTLLASGILGYLLVASLVDHWVVPGGLGFVGRLLLCIGLIGGTSYYIVARFIPFLLRKVNPVYAAEAIERGQPMKNTLINFLLLRKQPGISSESMLEAMKEQAAVKLSKVPADAPVDRTMLIRLGYVFCVVLVVAFVYALFGPKDTIRSVNRVIAPWADLAPSTRVRIMEFTPGDVDRRRDEVVEVKVHTRNMRSTDQAVVFYSTSGKPEDDIAAPLRSDDETYWSATIPGGSEGLKQDLYYYVKVGDAESARYRIRVAATPVISVERVQYEYPAYTGLPPRIVERQGDLKGLEGTRVVLTAETNQRIRSAYITFDSTRRRDVELATDESVMKASGSFQLTLTKDRRKPEHGSYMLRFANIDGQENPKPIEHKIDITADQAPDVKVVEPTTPNSQELSVPLGSSFRITLQARDPDFQLADLAVVVERIGVAIAEERLLPEPRYGAFSNTLVFEPSRYGLKVGDRVTFYGRAKDNKAPQPNVAETVRYTLVVAPSNGGDRQQPKADDRNQPNPPNQPNEPQPNGRQEGRPQPGNDPNRGEPQDGSQPPKEGSNKPDNQQPNGQQRNGKGQQQPNTKPENGKPGSEDSQQGQSNNSQPNKGQPNDGSPNQQPNAGPQGDSNSGNSQDRGGMPPKSGNENPANRGANGGDQPNAGEKGNGSKDAENEKPVDPEANPAEVFNRLKNHFDKQDGKQPEDAGRQKPEDRNSTGGDKRKPGEQGNKNQPNPNSDDASQQQGKKPGEDPQGNNQPNGKQPEGRQPENSADSKNGADSKPTGSGEKPGPQQNQGMNEAPKPGSEKGAEKGTEKGSEKGAEKGSEKGAGQGTEKGSGESADPNGKGGRPEDENGKKPPKNDGDANSGAPSGAGKQSGGDSGKTGGDQGSGSNASGNKTDSSGKQAGSPGAGEGMRADDKTQGTGERREGKNDGGREIDRKSTDGNGGRKMEAGEGQKPGDTAGAKPTDPKNGQASGEKPSTDAPKPGEGGKPSESGNQSPPKTGTANEGNPTPNREGKQSNSGDGGKSGSASSKPEQKPAGDKSGEKPAGEGEKPSDNNGQQSGNQKNPGEVSGGPSKNEGSPESQEMAKPRDKTGGGQPGSKEESKSNEGKSPGHGKHESDARGDSAGDKPGEGEEGGGQKSNMKGTGASGSNTPGDQGSGAAGEEGDAATGNKSGDKARGPAPTQGNQPNGKPSGDKGNGSQSRLGGDKPGGSGESSQGSSGGEQPQDLNKQPSSELKPGEQSQSGGPQGQGGGGVPEGERRGPASRPLPPMSEEANLEYTKKATDLVLDRLKSQLDKGELDPELQKQFGDKEAAKKFYELWDAKRREAKQPGPQGDVARKEYQGDLKLLGLQPRTMDQQGRRTGDDDSRGLVGSRNSEPPAKYVDQYRAFLTGQGRKPAEPPKKP